MKPTEPGPRRPDDDGRAHGDQPHDDIGEAGDAGEAGGAGDTSSPFVVPDDARELVRDLEAWRREERWLRRRRRVERLFVKPMGERRASLPLILAALSVLVTIGAMMSMLPPRQVRPPTPPVPLDLAAPTIAPGTAGGLLPDVTLTVPRGATRARDVRPAVFAIVPSDCRCAGALADLAAQAAPDGLTVFATGSPAQRDGLTQLTTQVGRANLQPATDPTGGLVSAYAPHGLTVVFVHADGVTGTVMRDFSTNTSVEALLADLKQPAS